jgi:hypothetical protein
MRKEKRALLLLFFLFAVTALVVREAVPVRGKNSSGNVSQEGNDKSKKWQQPTPIDKAPEPTDSTKWPQGRLKTAVIIRPGRIDC